MYKPIFFFWLTTFLEPEKNPSVKNHFSQSLVWQISKKYFAGVIYGQKYLMC